MFTGIVEELGTVLRLDRAGDSARLEVEGPLVTADAVHGASIAVNGVCLTVTDDQPSDGRFTVDVMAESLARTSLGGLGPGDRVNLERAMPADGRFGGHVVQGHVDGVGTVALRVPGDRWERVRVEVPAGLARYLVEKGSVTVDGVSLTVTAVSAPGSEPAWFEVGLIPTTLALTTLGRSPAGTPVNLEVDVLAKYVERITAFAAARDGHDQQDEEVR